MRRSLKRFTALVLSSVMIFSIIGCASKETGGKAQEETTEAPTKPLIKSENVQVTDEIAENIELVERLIKKLAKYREMVVDWTDEYDKPEEINDILEVVEDIDEHSEKISEIIDELDELPRKAESELVLATYDAAKEYAKELLVIFKEFSHILSYTVEIVDEIESTKKPDTTDQVKYFDKLYGEYYELSEALSTLNPPSCLAHEANLIIDAVNQYTSLIYGYYFTYKNEDAVRLTACNYLKELVDDDLDVCIDNYVDKMTRQVEHLEKLADEQLALLEEELLDNCSSIINEGIVNNYTYILDGTNVEVSCIFEDSLYPALYNHMDSLVTLELNSPINDADVMVSVELQGFTQKYEQKYTITSEMLMLDIKPTLTINAIDLNSEQDLQLVVSITDNDTGKVYFKETNSIKVHSLYDWPRYDKFRNDTLYTILAWLEPESDEIKELTRSAALLIDEIDISEFLNDELIVGYQPSQSDLVNKYGEKEALEMEKRIVMEQVIAIQLAMAKMGVKYNMSPFTLSTSSDVVQRVTLPTETLSSKSGICIDLSVVVASALQSIDMRPMIVLTPGHARVAVEIFDTGHYFMIEATNITEEIPDRQSEYDEFLEYMTPAKWKQLVQQEGTYIIDCSMSSAFGYTPLDLNN